MQTVQAYFAGAPGNSNVSIQIPRSGKIVGIQYAISCQFDATTETFTLEMATVPTLQANTNAAQGTMFVVRSQANGTAGDLASNVGINGYAPIPPVQVDAGQLLYVNAAGTTNTYTATLLIYLQ